MLYYCIWMTFDSFNENGLIGNSPGLGGMGFISRRGLLLFDDIVLVLLRDDLFFRLLLNLWSPTRFRSS